MEKLELRGQELFLVNEKKMDGLDPDRELAILEIQKKEVEDRIKIIKQYKNVRPVQPVQGGATSSEQTDIDTIPSTK